jgi:diaminohydroxyphosphoribosylaminopyrimidine deaminase/5-amino-6-(5-phosphoribosylamino)uracil reductase
MPDGLNMADVQFMRRALELAARGRGTVEPNPMVGCVIVRDSRVIGEGYHERFGGPHAEANALAACRESAAGGIAYVTLEPCCHSNKKTPPCVPRLIEAKLARVVVGCVDPNPLVSGRGIEQLRSAGIDVTVGMLEDECRQLNAAFFALTRERRPYVTLKWAESSDQKIAGAGGRRIWITNQASTRVVHELRARCDAILVGINTVLADDPLLSVRDVAPTRVLGRFVLDTHLRCPLDSRLVRSAGTTPLTVICTNESIERFSSRADELRNRAVELLAVPADAAGRPSFAAVLAELGKRELTHLLVEPGAVLGRSLLEGGFTDRVWVFHSPQPIADADAPRANVVPYPPSGSVDLAGDQLTEYLNPSSRCFFISRPSADLVRVAAR